MSCIDLKERILRRWPDQVHVAQCSDAMCQLEPHPDILAALSSWLFGKAGCAFAGIVVEEGPIAWELRYIYYGGEGGGWVHVVVNAPLDEKTFPSISQVVHAADWHEREAEDMFGLVFVGHPRLGDFILHDDAWQEGVEPMRHGFNAQTALAARHPDPDWRPRRIVQAPGSFVMPIGPVFSGTEESAYFQLETIGEEIIRAFPRLFYKYRAVEKIAEGRTVEDALLLAERFSATTAFAHGLAFCRAVESACNTRAPDRGRILRLFVAELERFRHHVAAIESICESTGLAVAASQAALLEEDLLRVCGALTGHRYLFGLLTPGGLAMDLNGAACRDALENCRGVLKRLNKLERMLRISSSFLDRLEEVGAITERDAQVYGLVGPVARASNFVRDLRKLEPYSGYDRFVFNVPAETEGDGYARLRILFEESRQSVRIMEQAADALSDGPVSASLQLKPNAALGWVEAPRGAAFHWLRLDKNGGVERYHIITPSFINWHGFHLSVEKFAFQDFPIILATMDLSVAENDR